MRPIRDWYVELAWLAMTVFFLIVQVVGALLSMGRDLWLFTSLVFVAAMVVIPALGIADLVARSSGYGPPLRSGADAAVSFALTSAVGPILVVLLGAPGLFWAMPVLLYLATLVGSALTILIVFLKWART